MPAVAVLGTVNVTPLVKLPLVLVLTEVGLVVSAVVSNLKLDTVELPAKPAPWTETDAPGLAGVPAEALLGVSVRAGVTVNAVPVAVTDSFCWSIANSVLLPSGTFGTWQPPFGFVPRIVPSGLAVSSHTSSVLKSCCRSARSRVAGRPPAARDRQRMAG